MRVLVAEDDPTSARVLEVALARGGYSVDVVPDGEAALSKLRAASYDALVTDWMMPKLDGIELIRRVRATVSPSPVIVMVTALSSAEARTHALTSGADDYLPKPVTSAQVLQVLSRCMSKRTQPPPRLAKGAAAPPVAQDPSVPFPAVVIAASTGGPKVVIDVLRTVPKGLGAAVYVVQHGPAWMLESFAGMLPRQTALAVKLASDGARSEPGTVFVAPGERHLQVAPGTLALEVRDGPEENFVKPAADPLFRSAAAAFGRRSIAVVLSGLGRDGTVGAARVAQSGGIVIVQDPKTAPAPAMPESVIGAGLAREVLPLDAIAQAIVQHVRRLTVS